VKFKTTLILLAVFILLLAAVLVFEPKKGKETAAKEEKLVDLAAADLERITLKKEDETISFRKDEMGDWQIIEPVEAKADPYEVNRLAEDFSSLKIERVVESEAKDTVKYEIPKTEVSLWLKGQDNPVKVLIGMENRLDSTFYAKKEGESRVVLIPSLLKSLLEKKTFDFRQKDVFKFETADVTAVDFRVKDIVWKAAKKDEAWLLEKPVQALAKKSRLDDLLNALANMKAKEFVAEEKKPEEIEKFGLKKPEYSVSLSLPSKNQEIVFGLHKEGETSYATTSLSTKIISVEAQVLTDLEKKVDDLREKLAVVFNSWEAKRIWLKTGGLEIGAAKDKDNKWSFEPGLKEEADGSKVESFIRKVEGLEASEFIDQPGDLKGFGLDRPQAEITIRVQEAEGKEKEVRLFVGSEDTAQKKVVVRNPELAYLFRVDSGFLSDVPKEAKDWKSPEPEIKK